MPAAAQSMRRWWRTFRGWRRRVPFWGGVVTIVAAIELLALTIAPLQIMLIQGLAGIGTLVIAAMLVALAVISWTHGHLRVICGVFIVILGLASFAVSNLGGFFVGLTLALVGGSLIFAWQPGEPPNTGADAEPPDSPDTRPSRGADTETSRTQPPDEPDEPEPRPDTGTAPRARGEAAIRPPSPSRSRPPRLLPRLACIVVVLAASFVAVPQASAHHAEPAAPCPSWWPWPCGDDDDSSEPDDPGDDEPDQPGDDDPGDTDPGDGEQPDARCDTSKLPEKPPELGTEAAEEVAKVLAACLKRPGRGQASDRDLPTASTVHPVLNAEVMAMSGLESGGVVNVPTAAGSERALEFSMDTLELTDMDQSAGVGGSDARLHVINMGSTAVLSGSVRLYVQRMEGLIFGAVPIVLTAGTPLPPIPVPYLVITEAEVDTAFTRADRVDLPDLHEPTR